MKKRINYIVLILCSISIFSCNDWLQEDPRTFISPTSFYKTIDDFDGALKGLYPQEITMDLVEVFADFNDKPESSEQVGDIWNNNPGFGFKAIRSAWSHAYSSIKNANMVLQSLESVDFPAETTNSIIGAAKFIRAWCYFDLVQLYGDVPLRNSVVTSSTDVAITKSSEKEIRRSN